MAKKYGLSCRSGGGMSDASGSLHYFNTVSFEKFILDIETYTRMKYYFGEMPADEEALAFDAIKEAVEEENPNQALYASIQKRINKFLSVYQCLALAPEKREALGLPAGPDLFWT